MAIANRARARISTAGLRSSSSFSSRRASSWRRAVPVGQSQLADVKRHRESWQRRFERSERRVNPAEPRQSDAEAAT